MNFWKTRAGRGDGAGLTAAQSKVYEETVRYMLENGYAYDAPSKGKAA